MQAGGNPAIYLCTEKGNEIADALLSLLATRLKSRKALHDVAPVLPLIETFGRKYFSDGLLDFHWEREWRVPGSLRFGRKDVVLGLCDKRDIRRMERRFPPVKFVDPLTNTADWGKRYEKAKKAAWDHFLDPFP